MRHPEVPRFHRRGEEPALSDWRRSRKRSNGIWCVAARTWH